MNDVDLCHTVQRVRHRLGDWQECRIPGPTPDLLNQNEQEPLVAPTYNQV